MSGQTAESIRNRELAAIHMGAKQLGLDRDTYEQMLFTIARVRSAADLDWTGRKKVIEHLRSRGFKAARPTKPRDGRPRPPGDRSAMVAKIRAMLTAAGRVDAYADGMSQRMFNVERYEWLPPDQLHKLVAALVIDQRRREAKHE